MFLLPMNALQLDLLLLSHQFTHNLWLLLKRILLLTKALHLLLLSHQFTHNLWLLLKRILLLTKALPPSPPPFSPICTKSLAAVEKDIDISDTPWLNITKDPNSSRYCLLTNCHPPVSSATCYQCNPVCLMTSERYFVYPVLRILLVLQTSNIY